MALDGFVPADVKELRDVFRAHKFPYGFGFKIDNKINEYKGVVITIGKEPGFLDNYKISHVFDAGENFLMDDGSVQGDEYLSPLYYPIGHSKDFLTEPDKIRKMKISDEAKKVIVAKFLRFAHPMNYFLTPGKKLHSCATKVYMNDIGEDPIMIHYVKQYLKKEYKIEYTEFLNKIMWRDEYIGIKYEPSSRSLGVKARKKPAPATAKKGDKILEALEAEYSYPKLIEVAACYLCNNFGLKKIEKQMLLKENLGYEAQKILKVLGIETDGSMKNSLNPLNIDSQIAGATGTLKDTLIEIKKRKLI